MRVLIFGDSITQGYWDSEGGWVERIRRHYDGIKVQNLQGPDQPAIFNLGVDADNTQNILARIEAETIVRTRHNYLPVVVLQIGINDSTVSYGNVQVEPAAYRQNLETIIETAQPLSTMLIFVGLTACDETQTNPAYWGDHYCKNASIKIYEDIMAAVAKANNIPFTPIFDKFMAAINSGEDLLIDGLHPNNAGHELIAKLVLPALDKLLKG
jgi:lysophospholipase L1-like esterase